MNDTTTLISIYVALLTSYGLICAFLWKALTVTEQVLPDAKVKGVGAWLYDPLPARFGARFYRQLLSAFDRIFKTRGYRILRVRTVRFPSVLRSITASLLTIFSLSLVYVLMLPRDTIFGFGETALGVLTITLEIQSTNTIYEFELISIGISVVVNLVADYVSFAESRYMILLLALSRSRVRRGFLLLVDLILTLLIFVSIYLLVFPLGYIIYLYQISDSLLEATSLFLNVPIEIVLGGIYKALDGIASAFNYLFATDYSISKRMFGNEGFLYTNLYNGVFAYSTLFTSVWVWIYLIVSSLEIFPKARPIERILGELSACSYSTPNRTCLGKRGAHLGSFLASVPLSSAIGSVILETRMLSSQSTNRWMED